MLTLMGTFALPLVRQTMGKVLFGKPKIAYTHVLQIEGFLYESGALVGRALVEKATVLEQVLGNPEFEGALIAFMIKKATERRDKFPDETSFAMLIIKSEMAKFGLSPLDGMSDTRVSAALQRKLPVTDMEPQIETLCAEGIGFGLAFPAQTESMYRATYEQIDKAKWAQYRSYGLVIPEHPTEYSLEQREREALAVVAAYVHEFHSELDNRLGLTHLLT